MELAAGKNPEPIPPIFVDYGEEMVAKLLERLGCDVIRMRLGIGDFVVSDEVAIERKSSRDFLASLFDGRLFEQAIALKQAYARPLMIVEGIHANQNNNSTRGAILSLALDYGLPIVWSEDEQETAAFIVLAAKRELKPEKEFGIIAKRKPMATAELQLFVVSSLPGVGYANAKKLLQKFRTIEKIFRASEKQLSKVIGPKKAEKIKEIFASAFVTEDKD